MKKNKFMYLLLTIFLLVLFYNGKIVSAEEEVAVYDGELGAFYSQSQTTFKIYSSNSNSVKVVIEGLDNEKCPLGVCSLIKDANNVWIGYAIGDLNGKEYTLTIEDKEGNIYENVLDPYGKYLNQEGNKNVICDDNMVSFSSWEEQTNSLLIKDQNKIIYGINVANFTKHNSWTGLEENRGKLLALNEAGTKYNGTLTGADYIRSLGITYLEFSEIYDINNPYSIDKDIVSGVEVYSGALELKQVVNNYFSSGIGIILSFDYKNISDNFLNILKIIDENQYLKTDGALDLNKKMTQKYIKDLLLYYVETYKVSGIKIENMADYSVNLINEISSLLITEERSVLIYGDGSYKNINENNAGENNLHNLNNISMLNGSLNYSMVGDLLNKEDKGILDGNYSSAVIESLKFALLSSVDNGQIDYSLVEGVSYNGYWGNTSSYQIINYLGKDEGLSIFDKLIINNLSGMTGENILKQKIILAFSSMMISGGIPYIYSGNEFLISYLDTSNDSNSICDDTANFCFYKDEEHKIIDWSYAQKNEGIVDAFKSLINFRKSNNSVAQTNSNIIKNNVEIYTNEEFDGVIGFVRNYPNAYTRDVEKIFVVINYSNNDYTLTNMGKKGWYGLYKYNSATRDGTNIILKANSFYSEVKEKQPKINSWITLILVLGVIGLLYYLNIILNKRLVEKKGYDIKDISRKYRPFINKNKIKKEIEENVEEDAQEELQENNEENKNGN